MSVSIDPVFAALAPAPVWAHFAVLCSVPRSSKHEAALRDHLQQWACTQGLQTAVDAAGNLLVRKPASAGCEAVPGLVLQAHLDMVCQKNSDSTHDFMRDPIRPLLRDGWLSAPDTTLGADNGIGVALALAVLEDRTLQHGPIEALFTVDEEAGMGGAQGLQPGWLQGRLMLNLDTEEWGEFYLGCAGGLDVQVDRVGRAEPLPSGYVTCSLNLRGLRGGHSGVNIHEERGNAIKLLVRVLQGLGDDLGLWLMTLHGGTARNALPREATATFALPVERQSILHERVVDWQAVLHRELAAVEAGLVLQVVAERLHHQPVDMVMSLADQRLWLQTLHAAPHGVRRMSQRVPGVVETSNNLGMVDLQPGHGSCNFMVRSLVDTAGQALADEIVSLFALSGTAAECSGHYPGWAPDPASPLLAICQQVYQREFGEASKVQVIHAGLECGIIAAIYPGMDIVSFGPTIRGAHAPGEAVDVASVARTWHLLTAILEAIPAR